MHDYTNINEVWINSLCSVLSHGREVFPRGMLTKELLGHQTVIDMRNPILNIPCRNLNYRFLYGEAWWILSGSNRVSDIAMYMNAISKFSDDGIVFNGAYGPPVSDQIGYVVQNLKDDESSRQALLSIWRPNPRPSKDIPCTVALQFFIRGHKLYCNATMRSSDLWLGWVYDVFNFSMISSWILIALRDHYPELQLGDLILTTGSRHLYSNDFNKADEIVARYEGLVTDNHPVFKPNIYTHPDDLTADLKLAGLAISPNEFMPLTGHK